MSKERTDKTMLCGGAQCTYNNGGKFLLTTFLCVFCFACISLRSFAAMDYGQPPDGKFNKIYHSGDFVNSCGKCYTVSTPDMLLNKVHGAKAGDTVKLLDDIALNEPLYIDVPMSLDLNSHKIIFMSCESGVNVETKQEDGNMDFVAIKNGCIVMYDDGDYAVNIRKSNVFMEKLAVFGVNGNYGIFWGQNGGIALCIENTENMVILSGVSLVGGNPGIGMLRYGKTGESISGSTRKLMSIGDGFYFRYKDIMGFVAPDSMAANK